MVMWEERGFLSDGEGNRNEGESVGDVDIACDIAISTLFKRKGKPSIC